MNDFEEKNISNAIKCDEEKLHPASFFSKVSSEKQSAQYGDVIGVYRQGRGYEHYGIYVDDECVIEYAGEGGVAKELLNAEVRETTLEKFIGKSKNYFVLSFSETKKTPVKQRMLKGEIKETECTTYANNIDEVEEQKFDNILEELTAKYFDIYNVVCPPSGYHLYSPSETVKRAISCKGEKEYNFFFHNCEHFAVWCKTGLYTSFQVKKYKDTAWKMFDLLFNVTGVIAPNPLNGAVNLMRKFNVEDIITKNISKDKTFEIRVKEMTDEHLEFFIPSVYQYSIYDIDYEKLKKSGITLISFDIDDTIQDSLLTKGANQVQKKVPKFIRKIPGKVSPKMKNVYNFIFPSDLKNLFRILKQMGFTVVFLTNGSRSMAHGVCKALGADKAIGHAHKPNPLNFYSICQEYGIKPSEMMHVGDKLDKDIVGGNLFGISTCLVRHTGIIQNQYNRRKTSKESAIVSELQKRGLWRMHHKNYKGDQYYQLGEMPRYMK